MATYTDQLGRTIELEQTPVRIISTVPSLTELLHSLGLDEEVVGITAFCVHPSDWLKRKTVIGGTKDLKIDVIRSLEPDLIIANKEENIREQIEPLAADIPTWISDINNLQDALNMIAEVGKITGRHEQAKSICNEIEHEAGQLISLPRLDTAYFIWKDPYMLAGKQTFIGSMLGLCGLENVAPEGSSRYPSVTVEELAKLAPRVVLLASEPYSYTAGDAHEIGQILPNSLVKVVDGEMFSWYGNRLIQAMQLFARIQKELRLRFGQGSY